MFTPGSDIFLQLTEDSDRRKLSPFKVERLSGGVILATPEGETPDLDPGAETIIYFERGREFVKQPATIEAPEASDNGESLPAGAILIRPIGKPVSAEERQCYRTQALLADVTVRINGDDHCNVVDISPMGMSFLSRNSYGTGQILDITVICEGEEYEGRASVQGARDLPGGETRYGVYCADSEQLQKGLQKVSMHVQREQLKRASGKAA
ncbi:MAG: hypothetical protein EA376_13885 [Phycisphaeraceae bacterium]|nr:MAG: hypothetical protein EA376_13885 [Phycisphaeraceae bacterium]